MERQQVVYSIKRWQLVAALGALVFLVVSLPVGVYAATGQVVNLQDSLNGGSTGSGRVINQRLVTNNCDINSTSVTGANCTRISGGRTLVEAAPATPYVTEIVGVRQSGQLATEGVDLPVGKQFVIETVSGRFTTVGGGAIYLKLRVTTGGTTASYALPIELTGTFDGTTWFNVPVVDVRLYADAGSKLFLEAYRSSSTGATSFTAQVSGHLL